MVRTLVLRKNTLATLSTVYYAKVGTAKVPKKANPVKVKFVCAFVISSLFFWLSVPLSCLR